jgi:hypothetical protein
MTAGMTLPYEAVSMQRGERNPVIHDSQKAAIHG